MCLKVSRRTGGKWQKEHYPPPVIGAGRNEQRTYYQPRGQSDYSEPQPFTLFGRADILYTDVRFVALVSSLSGTARGSVLARRVIKCHPDSIPL